MDKPDLKKKVILVVEDEERNWFVLRDIIQFCNGTAIWAESAMAGISLVKENKDIELVFMDIRLPFMSGTEATIEIKKIRPELTVIAQTAFTERDQIKEYLASGCVDCIFKPINFQQAVGLMKDYLLDGKKE